MAEEWKDIPGYEKLYKVSNGGRVQSYDRYPGGSAGPGFIKGREMRMHTTHNGYFRLELYDKNSKRRKFFVHRLVWLAFKGEIPKGMQINHINGRKTDNRLDNLEILTHKEHCKRTMEQGLVPKGKAWWTPAKRRAMRAKVGPKMYPQLKDHCKILPFEVAEIKGLFKTAQECGDRVKLKRTAYHFGTHVDNLKSIRDEKTWGQTKPKEIDSKSELYQLLTEPCE